MKIMDAVANIVGRVDHGTRSVISRLVLVMVWLLAAPIAISQTWTPEEEEQRALAGIDHDRGVVSANERGLIKAQVLHVVDKYYEYFSTGQMVRIPAETHLVPWVSLGSGVVHSDAAETASRYAARRDYVVTELNPEYAKSTYHARNVCVLSDSAAITSGQNIRTTHNNGIVSVEGVAYVLTKTEAGWRIAGFSATTPDTVVRCTEEQ